MATNQTIKLKRGTSTPTTSNIASGEVAIDTSAKKFYVNDDGTVKEIGGGGVTGITSFTSTAEIMRISSSDKIGIGPGVGNASARLQVYQSGSGDLMKIQNGNGAAQIRFTNADNNETYFGLDASGNIVIDGVENDSFILSTNNTERLRVLNSGNVGIGTTTPTQALDVNGTVELNNLTVGGAQGSDGQVLTSTGSGVGWENQLAGVTAITISGELDAGSLDISGDIDVDGTANLDVVDIDGAVDMASTLAVGGVATFSDHITLADSKYVKLGNDADFIIYHDGTSNYVQAAKQDSDIILRGNDGGSGVNMLTLDTSAAGKATFNAGATFGDSVLVGTTTQQYAGTDLTVGSTSDSQNGIQITTSSSGDGYVLFGDGSSSDAFRGQVSYNHGSDYMGLTTAGSERVRINSAGNVGIGGNAGSGYRLDVMDSGATLARIRSTADSDVSQYFYSAGTTATQNIYFGDTGNTAAAGIRYYHNGDNLTFTGKGAGTEMARFNSSGQLGIGSTNPQNVLDLGSATAGRGIAWGYTNGTAHYNTIWSEHGTASIVVGAGLKGSTSASTFLNPYTGTYGYAAIELDSFSDDGIKFYVGADASRTKDAAITPSEVMRIATNGTVGIGTTAPAYTLDVDSTIHIGNDGSSGYTQSRLIFDCNAATRGAGMYFHNQANDVEWFAGNPYTSSDSFDITRQATTSHAESTATHTLALMTINGSTGNLGIGLATPTSRLHVNDDTDDGYVARFSQDHATGYGVLIDVDGTANGDPALVVNNAAGTTGLYVSQAGNVGIGNTAPTQKLDVTGTIETNNLTIGGAQGSDGQVLTSTGSGVAWESAAGISSFNAGGLVSNRYYAGLISTDGGSTTTLATNTLYYLPFIIFEDCQIDGVNIVINGGTGNSGDLAQIAIYGPVPGDLSNVPKIATTSTFAVDSGYGKSAAITATSVTAGVYLYCITANTASLEVRGYGSPSSFINYMVGVSSASFVGGCYSAQYSQNTVSTFPHSYPSSVNAGQANHLNTSYQFKYLVV